MRSESPDSKQAFAARPEVIVDFSVERGLLTVHLKNVGERPAFLVKTTFDKPFTGGMKLPSRRSRSPTRAWRSTRKEPWR